MTKLPQKLPEKYDAKAIEKKWQNYWRQEENFKKIFAWKNDLPKEQTFVIDTPPPTVSGLLHMGHVFSYTQADFVARFQRMLGKDVFYPMGFDDNGLPTERLVEKVIGKKAGVFEAENGRGSFVAKCREVVEEAEKEFEAMFNSIALSVDWEQKYQTISPESQKISQASFVDLYRKGLVERKFEPVFWDISDRTALAQADLVDKEMPGMMNEIEFDVITIMTTRPELLPACVAVMVHPDDSRYQHLHGKFAITPLFGVKVPIIADDLVQMDKGTGAVMCCTFGDETDIKWWRKHNLPSRVIIEKNGTISRLVVVTAYMGDLDEDGVPEGDESPTIGNEYLGLNESKSKFCRHGFRITPVDVKNGETGNLLRYHNRLVAGKTIKQAKEAIIEALKNTRSNHSPLEGESKGFSPSVGGQNSKSSLKAQRFYSTEILSRAQELRKNTTDAEGLLWYYLQNKQLDGHKFRRQQPIGDYIVDFVCLEKKLVVELDGGQHGEDSAIKYDQNRTDFLQQSGFTVLRFWNREVFENMSDVLDSIFFNLDSDPSPHRLRSATLPQGEGDSTLSRYASTGPQGEGDNSEFQSILLKQTPITHSVKCAERSGVPIEILVAPQWFIKILDKKAELKAQANKCKWFPDYMRIRIEQWIDGLSWDWCISRQRFFGVPFPIWYSKRAGEEGKVLVAEINQLPCDPLKDLPRGQDGKYYSREEVTAETDIMDTWATSSISPQLSSRGISDEICFDQARHQKLFPADLRPQAHEIIRTWAFYTIVKAYLHSLPMPKEIRGDDEAQQNRAAERIETYVSSADELQQSQNSNSAGHPWKNLMISGWCLAADKTKMSKSKGNVVTPTSLIEEKGSDIVRYWASTSHLGADTAYSEEVFKIGQKLITKLFNAAKFVSHICTLTPSLSPQERKIGDLKNITEAADLWILSKLHQTIKRATESFEIFEYARAREAIEEFFWKDFCDNYLEICKVRAYGLAAEKLAGLELSEEEKTKIQAKQQSAILTLKHCLNRLLKLFAPFIPHICDEIFSAIFTEEFEKIGSVNARGTWPKLSEEIFDQKFCDLGEAALAVIFEVRKFKSENNLSMKTELKKIIIDNKRGLSSFAEDLKNVCNAKEIEFANQNQIIP